MDAIDPSGGRPRAPADDQPTLLLVDDDDAFRNALGAALGRRGFAVTLAEGPAEARRAAAAQVFEHALVDVRMPGESGIDLCVALRQIDEGTRIVVLTGYGTIANAVEAEVRAGAVDYLTKPGRRGELRGCRDTSCAGSRRTAPRTCPRSSASSTSTCSGCSPTARERLRGGAAAADAPPLVAAEDRAAPAEQVSQQRGRCPGNFVLMESAFCPRDAMVARLRGSVRGRLLQGAPSGSSPTAARVAPASPAAPPPRGPAPAAAPPAPAAAATRGSDGPCSPPSPIKAASPGPFPSQVPAVGQFVTGDYYVVGPVTISGISPAPQTAAPYQNGSVKNLPTATGHSAFDQPSASTTAPISRGSSTRPSRLYPPFTLAPGDTLVSAVSLDTVLTLPEPFAGAGAMNNSPIKNMSVLTVLGAVPGVGRLSAPRTCDRSQALYYAGDVQRSLLPSLTPPNPSGTPPLSRYEPMMIRPWIDVTFFLWDVPGEYMASYSQHFTFVEEYAALLLTLDFPRRAEGDPHQRPRAARHRRVRLRQGEA